MTPRTFGVVLTLGACMLTTAPALGGGGFGGKFQRLIAAAPVRARAELQAVRELGRAGFRALSADARLLGVRRGLHAQFHRTFGRALDTARVHALRPGAGLRRELRRGLLRAWHLAGRYAQRKLRLAKIPAVFATVRRKTRDGFREVARVGARLRLFKVGMFDALFPL